MSDKKQILYLGDRRFSCGDKATYTKGDMFLELLREELCRQHDVLNWGWAYRYNWVNNKHLSDVIDFFGTPDMVFSDDFGNYNKFGMLDIDAVKVSLIGDFYYGMAASLLRKSISIYSQYDVLLAVCDSAVRLMKEHLPDKKCYFWPWSVDTNFFRNYSYGMDRPIDVFFGAATSDKLYGPDRLLIQNMIYEMGREELETRFRIVFYYRYVDTLNMSKIAISNNSKYGFMPKKVLEIMACGALLLTDKCDEFDVMGIEDGKHMVVYKDVDDLRDKIYYYLENDSEREQIAITGNKLVVREFSTRVAVHKMMELIFGDTSGVEECL